ncbi:Guanosine-3',5'-bis(diphosphate) 3'-pyrophosphohydrolase / GTP pyrophosphokinase, (p)ppGpp synthetase II [hydrothermal vent metagenome]|uniref:Guanosine-3',5'-bis(Diphosphate) 3'-pyrophosphohydrolase / GTP pyrophosphokinase, (P)ppGpp synthetase II n=1 Tax=hydrothermal vent metagenome TaxID=652676 RepID=A0A3B0R2S3_9ZZZZ
MMRQYELVERVTSYDQDADEALLNKAYVYAMKAHGSQKRASGAPYFTHPLEVAQILTDFKLDAATIVAALLHDVVEDTDATSEEIEKIFGSDIATLVDGLTKISRLDLVTKEAAQAENLRKLLLAVSQDVRVLMVKLADRLHNMRTIEHVRAEKRKRISQETLDIYAPLAGRMGMHSIREELEDIAFRALEPDAWETVTRRLTELRAESGDIIEEIEFELKKKLKENKINATIFGREKRPYSVWSKMERKHLSLNQLSDIFGFRVIVDTADECYRVLGVVHQTWRSVPGRFKDYISNAKQNDYKSIHTTVIGPHRKRVELQIRTQQMDLVAEQGVAAHGFYKDIKDASKSEEGVSVPAATSNAYRWLRRLVDMMSSSDNPREFLEHTRLELFHDQVFAFTPKGDLIALPKGANAIDFAYSVHTDVGNSCVGCRVNGRHVPLLQELQNGDEVEIITSAAQTPPAAWEGATITGKAKSAIRRATKLAVRTQYAGLGREILDHCVERAGARYSQSDLEQAVKRLGMKDVDDALAALGRGEISSVDILSVMDIEVEEDTAKPFTRSNGGKKYTAIEVRGADKNLPLKIDPATGAVPGERIVGIFSPGEGITIYPIFAHKLQEYEDQPDRWIDLAWGTDVSEKTYPARIQVVIHNEVGALAQVTQIIGDMHANIENLTMVSRQRDFYDLDIVVEVNGIKHLTKLMKGLNNASLVSTVERKEG